MDSRKLKYIPKTITTIIYLFLIIIVLFLLIIRENKEFKIIFLEHLFPDFYQHISNFSLSYLFYSAIGYIWLLKGIHFNYIIGLGIIIILINFIYECWLPILNVPDIIDAYYGLTGTITCFIFLFCTKKYGLKPVKFN